MADERVDILKEESLPQLLRQLSSETTTLMRQEIDLAKVELSEKLDIVRASAVGFGVGAVVAIGAVGALTAFFIAGLAIVLPVWAAALIVTIVYLIVAYVAIKSGQRQLARATPVAPEQTVQSIKGDIEWVKTRAQSSKK